MCNRSCSSWWGCRCGISTVLAALLRLKCYHLNLVYDCAICPLSEFYICHWIQIMKLCIKSNSNQIPLFIFFSPKSMELEEGEMYFVLCSCTGLVVPVLWVSHTALNIYSILSHVLSVEWKLGSVGYCCTALYWSVFSQHCSALFWIFFFPFRNISISKKIVQGILCKARDCRVCPLHSYFSIPVQ